MKESTCLLLVKLGLVLFSGRFHDDSARGIGIVPTEYMRMAPLDLMISTHKGPFGFDLGAWE